jgi:hypothetical protein
MTYRKSEAIARWRGESVVGASEGWARLFAAGACARLAHQLLCAISALATAAPETEARLGVAAPEKHAAPWKPLGLSLPTRHSSLLRLPCLQPTRASDRIDDAKLGSKLSPRRQILDSDLARRPLGVGGAHSANGCATRTTSLLRRCHLRADEASNTQQHPALLCVSRT